MQRTVLGDIEYKQTQKQHDFHLKELNIVNRNNYVMRQNMKCHERMKQEKVFGSPN